jgi:anionic cell wall polymer biosynthesis LytR-Cps2A-Psr (LCP) family protein
VSRINGGFKNGGFTLRLPSGTSHIDGDQALALARTRKNLCAPNEDDRARARRQQKILSAMKSRVVSPAGFVRLPLISWAAPKAVKSDMGGPRLLGYAVGIAINGNAPANVLPAKPSPGGGSGLTIDDADKQRAVAQFLR